MQRLSAATFLARGQGAPQPLAAQTVRMVYFSVPGRRRPLFISSSLRLFLVLSLKICASVLICSPLRGSGVIVLFFNTATPTAEFSNGALQSIHQGDTGSRWMPMCNFVAGPRVQAHRLADHAGGWPGPPYPNEAMFLFHATYAGPFSTGFSALQQRGDALFIMPAILRTNLSTRPSLTHPRRPISV